MSDDEYGSPETLQAGGVAPGSGSSGRQHTPSHRKGPRFSWTPAYEATFFRSLCESVKLGLKDNHSFKQEAWDRACTALAERHGAFPQKTHLINKSDNARKKFRLWRGLREDPDFLYNPTTKIVTASEEAWRAHIQREPLSKSLRNRPFEHEDYMEILFPDVIGSGGAPKRITKPRRKDLDGMLDADDIDTPGTNVLNLVSADASGLFQSTPTQTPIQPPTVPSNGTIRPISTTIPARTSIASTSALTPPDEDAPQTSHTRKRFLPSNTSAGDKRRRTGNNNYIDLTHPSQVANPDNPLHQLGSNSAAPNMNNNPSHNAHTHNPSSSTSTNTAGVAAVSRSQQFQEAMIYVAEQARKNPPTPRWSEQAMEIFFRDFCDEEMDLQIKIGEKVLCDTNKAMMFCMMPTDLRKHWVKRLRELHNRLDTAGASAAAMGNGVGLQGMGNGAMLRNGSQQIG